MNNGVSLSTQIEPDQVGDAHGLRLRLAGPEFGSLTLSGTADGAGDLVTERTASLTSPIVWERCKPTGSRAVRSVSKFPKARASRSSSGCAFRRGGVRVVGVVRLGRPQTWLNSPAPADGGPRQSAFAGARAPVESAPPAPVRLTWHPGGR